MNVYLCPIHVYIACMYLCVSVCMFIHIDIDTHTQVHTYMQIKFSAHEAAFNYVVHVYCTPKMHADICMYIHISTATQHANRKTNIFLINTRVYLHTNIPR
jgi:hypothetical protein